MGKIDEIFQALVNLEQPGKAGVSALELSTYINLDRANVSRYLNQLFDEKRIERINGRPVLYRSVRKSNNSRDNNSLDLLVGAKLSLQVSIQQAKAAILYPPRGLHTLIFGETGVGKSMFAELMYQFAKESQMIATDAPFIRFNCADYADNPQLVMAQIFGVKKGAYSGADSDKDGLMKKADQGIFFLDEVHRLSPQGQEMLFTYIDNGYFRPLGETEKLVKVEVQIIAATTEDPQSYLLKTFMRRIPMIITLPSLKERSLQERYCLLEEFIQGEAKRLGKKIYINKDALISYLLYDCPNNIGQLKSDVQLSCAKAFLNYKAHNRDYLLIGQADLHQRVKRGLMRIQEKRDEIKQLLDNQGDILMFGYNNERPLYNTVDENKDYKNETHFYGIIEKKLEKLKEQGLAEKEISEIINIDIESYFNKYLSDLPELFPKEEIAKIVDIEIVNLVEEILTLAQERLDKRFDKKVYYGLVLHLRESIERIRHGQKIYHPKLNLIRVQYPAEFMAAMEIAKMIDDKFAIEIPLDEIGYLTMFLASKPYEMNLPKNSKVGVLLIMHGQSTASSMAQVANSLIGEDCIQAMDMPLTMRAEIMYEQAKQKLREMDSGKGVLLLVDMGSLANFGIMISEETGIASQTIDMVSTPMVIEAGRKALTGLDLGTVYKACMELRRCKIQANAEKTNKRFLIITACFTGEGAAERLKEIIQASLDIKAKAHIVSMNILDHSDFLDKVQGLRKEYQILAIVGTVDVFIDQVPFIPATDIISGEGIEKLAELIRAEQDYPKIKSSLKNHIKTVDAERLVEDIRTVLYKIEDSLNVKLPEDVKTGIVLHISFFVDKMKSGGEQIAFSELSDYIQLHGRELALVRQAMSLIERNYHIAIQDIELAYIVRMVLENSV